MATRHRKRPRRRLPPAASAGKGTLRLALVLTILVGVNLYVFLWRGGTSIPAVMEQAAMAGQKDGKTPEPKEPSETPSPDGVDATTGSNTDSNQPSDGQPVKSPPDSPPDTPPVATDRWVEGEVKPGDSLGRVLRRAKLEPNEADAVLRALRDHMDFRKIRPGQKYRVRFDPKNELMEFEFRISRTITVRAVRDKSGKLVGKKDQTRTELRIQEVGGRVDSSLYAAIKRAGEDTNLVSFFVDVFAYDMNFFTDTHKGDTFRLLIEKEYVEGEFLRYRNVVAAEYSGKAGTFRALHWKAPDVDEGRYYDEQGRSVEKSLLKTPLKFSRVSSKFNPNRMHPILHKRRGHMGVDYAAPTGTPIRAAADGKIAFRGRRGGGGNVVILKHGGGLETVYMHLSRFRKGQRVGQRVKAKNLIGYVGSTGMSTGPHLHFGVKKNGRYVDPLKLAPTRKNGVASKHRAAYLKYAKRTFERLSRIVVPGTS